MGNTKGRLLVMSVKNDGKATARPIVFVPKFGYSENSSDSTSTDGTWNVNTVRSSDIGIGMLYGAAVATDAGVMTSFNRGDE